MTWPCRLMNQGLIMKVFPGWKKIQRIVESGETAGIAPPYKLQDVVTVDISMSDVTRHDAKLLE